MNLIFELSHGIRFTCLCSSIIDSKKMEMELMIGENFINTEDSISIVITTDKTINCFIKGYHAYNNLWKVFINEELTTSMEPDNVVYKYAVFVKKDDVIVGLNVKTSW